MGWLQQSVFDERRKKAIALTQEERDTLTPDLKGWAIADTLDMARLSGLRRAVAEGNLTPWQALARLCGIDENTNPQKT